jgi:hypothetical protein
MGFSSSIEFYQCIPVSLGLFCRVLTHSADQLDPEAQLAAGPTASPRYCKRSDGDVKSYAIISHRCLACLGRAEG